MARMSHAAELETSRVSFMGYFMLCISMMPPLTHMLDVVVIAYTWIRWLPEPIPAEIPPLGSHSSAATQKPLSHLPGGGVAQKTTNQPGES